MKYSCNVYGAAGSRRVCYLLMPIDVDEASKRRLAQVFHCNLVEILVDDWDDALTPWVSPGVMPGDADFGGEAALTLRQLCRDIMPAAERRLGLEGNTPVVRQLAGVSLSGLFAVWAWMQGDVFSDIASISGSFWYDGFVDWLKAEGKRKQGLAYLSLGDKEGHTRVQRFKSVVADTAAVVDILRGDGARVVFQQTAGSHYAPMLPRLIKALTALSAQYQAKEGSPMPV